MNVKSYFKVLDLLFYALLAGQLIFAFITLGLTYTNSWHAIIDTESMYYFMVLIVVAGAYYGGNYIYKSMMEKIKAMKNLLKKFDQMRTAFIIKFALLEAGSFISLVFYLLTADYMFLIIALSIIFLFFISKMNKEKIINDMNLSNQEKQVLNNPDAIISSKM